MASGKSIHTLTNHCGADGESPQPSLQECEGHLSLIFLLNACLVFHGLRHSPFVSHSQTDGRREGADSRGNYLPSCQLR